MAKLEEIIKTEMSRSDSRTFSRIHLFREGSFLRAYEQSAWLMSRQPTMCGPTPTAALPGRRPQWLDRPFRMKPAVGQLDGLISGDYSELYGLLRALCASVGSRLFRVYTFFKQ